MQTGFASEPQTELLPGGQLRHKVQSCAAQQCKHKDFHQPATKEAIYRQSEDVEGDILGEDGVQHAERALVQVSEHGIPLADGSQAVHQAQD